LLILARVSQNARSSNGTSTGPCKYCTPSPNPYARNVKELGTVQSFDPLCEVQSDKASVEITSPFDGVVKEILVKEGEVAMVGQGLCVIEVDEEVTDGTSAEVSTPEMSQTIPNSKYISPTEQILEESSESAPRRLHPMDPNYSHSSAPNANPENVLAKPSVRHYARQHQIDLALLASGSGRDGRIEKKDIDAFLAQGVSAVSVDSVSFIPPAHTEQEVTVELGRTRYGMWKAMTKSLEIPHFGYDFLPHSLLVAYSS
jgi:2-oxoisovalerate dehydrogenase E2 component (dihydrolipoyl transacylase)